MKKIVHKSAAPIYAAAVVWVLYALLLPLLGALFLVGRHGVEGLGVGGGDGHADHIKHDAEGDEHRQHDDGHGVAGPLQRSGGEKAQQRRQRHRQQKDPQRR